MLQIGLRHGSRASSRKLHSIASVFGDAKAADIVGSAGSPDSIPKSRGLPEVIVTGRANAGKSSLFNAVLGRRSLLQTSKKAGRTRQLNFYRVGAEPGKLILVDAPGYGARGRPEWGRMFDAYLQTRKQLKRVYIVFNAKHPLNDYDTQMLSHLSSFLIAPNGHQPFTLQSIITKADCAPPDKFQLTISQMSKAIWKAAPLCLPPLVTSANPKMLVGIDRVRRNIAEACGLL